MPRRTEITFRGNFVPPHSGQLREQREGSVDVYKEGMIRTGSVIEIKETGGNARFLRGYAPECPLYVSYKQTNNSNQWLYKRLFYDGMSRYPYKTPHVRATNFYYL